jgi:hypothetical protein
MHFAFAGRRFHFGRALTGHMQRVLVDGFERRLRPDAPLFGLMLLQHLACNLMVDLDAPPLRPPHDRRVAFQRARSRAAGR